MCPAPQPPKAAIPMLHGRLIRLPHCVASGGTSLRSRVGTSSGCRHLGRYRGGDDERDGWVSDAYYGRFGNFPPVLYRRGTVRGLQVLMMQALVRGTPLTADEL